MVCAGYAKWLASLSAVNEQESWLAGMMLRLGEIVIAQHMPDSMASIEAQPCAPAERWKREREVAGFDEGQLAAEIARRWDFPENVASALEFAAGPLASNENRMPAVVHLAALIADMAASTASPTIQHLPLSVLGGLGLDAEKLQILMPKAESFSDISMLAA